MDDWFVDIPFDESKEKTKQYNKQLDSCKKLVDHVRNIILGGDAKVGRKYLDHKETSVVVAVLREIERELSRCYWNKNQKEIISPFANTGKKYHNSTFSVAAYNWRDERNESNFFYPADDLIVCWYKYLGRGVSVNVPANWTMDDLPDMLDKCREAIRRDFGETDDG